MKYIYFQWIRLLKNKIAAELRINIPHQQGEYLIKGIQYFPTLDCVDFDLIQKYSNKESYTEVPCTKDFQTYFELYCGIHYAIAMLYGNYNERTLSCKYFDAEEALRLGIIKLK